MRALAFLTLATLSWIAAPAAADGVSLTIDAKESACPAGKTFCFAVSSGQMSSVHAGSDVSITFKNLGNTEHRLAVTTKDKMDPQHKDTKTDDALASTPDDVPGGGQATVNAMVPASATGVYFWCPVAGHEQLGMWLEQSFTTTPPTTTKDGGKSPLPALLALAALALAAAAFRRR